MTIIFFLFNNFILLIKLILLVFFKLFFIPNVFVKYLLLLFSFMILYILWKYPRTRFKKLSQLRAYKLNNLTKYILKTNIEHLFNIFVISFGFILFIVVIFLLRYSNKNKNIDIKEKYFLIKDFYNMSSLYDFIINSILFISIFIIYIWLFIKIIKYFKYHIIKRHLYLVGKLFETNWYQTKYNLIYKKTIHQLHFNLIWKIQEYYKKIYYDKFEKKKPNEFNTLSEEEKNKYYLQKPVEHALFFTLYKEDRILFHLMTKWHYFLVFFIILYDLFYNNYQITHVFSILPWTFFFELYIRFSNFVEDLWIPHDQYLHTILYAKQIEIYDKDTLFIDGEFYDYNHAKIIYKTYVARDFKNDPNYL